MWNIYETCQLQLNVFNSYNQPGTFIPVIDRSEVGHLNLSSNQRQNLACVLVFVIINTTAAGHINFAQRSCHWMSLNKHIQVQDSKRHSHLLSLWFDSRPSSAGADGAVRSSKLMM